MNSQEIKNKDNQYIMHTYGRHDLVITSGEKAVAYDAEGNKYIDFTSGIGVNSLGYCDADWVRAVAEQAAKLNHTSNLYYTEPAALLAEKLCKTTDMANCFMSNSGAEANECALKLARKYSYDKYGAGRNTVVSLVNSFHGRTMATLTATGQDCFHDFYFPFLPSHEYVVANNAKLLDKALHKNVCAVIVELIQGEGGVNPLNKDYVAQLRKLTAQRDIILIVDEVQTGVGRTGYFTACEAYNLQPDVITLAKGLGGGLPIGCTLASEKLANVFSKGNHGTTYGGNPIVCAGALAVMDKVTDSYFLMKVRSNECCILDYFSNMKNVVSVSGMGIMIGVEIVGKTAQQVASEALKRGLLVLTAKEKIRLLPPLTIDFAELLEGLKILKTIIESDSIA